MRFFKALRYSAIGVFFTGVLSAIQGCQLSEFLAACRDNGDACLLVFWLMLLSLFGLGGEETTPPCTTGGTFSSGDLSVRIPAISDGTGPGSITQTLNVNCIVTITDVKVNIRLDHTNDADLEISVRHPDGTLVELSTKNGSSGDDYGTGAADCTGTFTVFDDGAATAITAGSAPFAGSFRPEGSLSDFDGKSSNGGWKLEILDNDSLDIGTLFCWELVIN